jgi:hypothetical protein
MGLCIPFRLSAACRFMSDLRLCVHCGLRGGILKKKHQVSEKSGHGNHFFVFSAHLLGA